MWGSDPFSPWKTQPVYVQGCRPVAETRRQRNIFLLPTEAMELRPGRLAMGGATVALSLFDSGGGTASLSKGLALHKKAWRYPKNKGGSI